MTPIFGLVHLSCGASTMARGVSDPVPPSHTEATAPAWVDLFLSYSRRDVDFARRLHAALEEHDKDVWVDWEDIPATAEWRAQIGDGIDGSNAVVFVLSPDSAASAECNAELDLALAANKRIVPVVRRDVDSLYVRPELGQLNWLFFREDDDFDDSFARLLEALDSDLAWLDAHTRLLKRAREWDTRERDTSLLLRGRDLAGAEYWLETQSEHAEGATPLQIEYTLASRRSSTRRQRLTLGAVTIALLMTMALAGVALVLRARSIDRERVARSRELASGAVSQLPRDAVLSLLLAQEAVDVRDTPQAVDSLRAAVEVSPVRTILRSTRAVRSVVFSPDGRLVATASVDGTARLWRTTSGRETAVLRHRSPVNAVSFSPNGKLVVTASDDGTAAIWRVATGRRLATLRHDGAVRTAAFTTSGNLVLTASRDSTARLWRVRDGAQVSVMRNPGALRLAALSPDGRYAVTIGVGSWAPRLWSVPDGRLLRTLPGVEYPTGAAFSRDGSLVVVAADARPNAAVFRVPTGKLVSFQDTLACCGPTASAVFSPDAKTVATVSPYGGMALWDTSKGDNEAFGPPGHGRDAPGATNVAFSNDGHLVAAGSTDGTTRWWRANGRLVAVVHQTGPVTAVAFAPDGGRIVTASADGTAVIWTTGNPHLGPPLPGRARMPRFSPATRSLFTVHGGLMSVIDVMTGAALWVAKVPEQYFDPVFSPDGRLLLIGTSESGAASLIDVATGNEIGTLPAAPRKGTYIFRFDGGGKLIVRSSYQTGVGTDVFEAATLRRIASIGLAAGRYSSVSPDGTRLITAGERRIWRLRRAVGGSVIAVLRNQSAVEHAGFSPGSSFVFTDGKGGTRLWAPTTGVELLRLPGDKAVFSPHDSTVVTFTGRVAHLWSTANGHEIATFPDVFAFVFSGDGALFATAGTSVRVWRAADRRRLAVLPAEAGSPIAFSSDDRLVLTLVNLDEPDRVWDVQTGSQVAVLSPLLLGWTSNFVLFVGSTEPIRSYVCYACLPLQSLRALARFRSTRSLTAAERETFLHESR